MFLFEELNKLARDIEAEGYSAGGQMLTNDTRWHDLRRRLAALESPDVNRSTRGGVDASTLYDRFRYV